MLNLINVIHFFNKIKNIAFALLVLFIFHDALRTQPAYNVQYIGNEFGIGDVDVITAIQSRNGNLWIGTKNQLYRFDGISTQVIGNNTRSSPQIPSNHVHALAEDEQGYIWVCTHKGPVIIDPVQQKKVDLSVQVPALQAIFADIHAVCNGKNNAVFFVTTYDLYVYQRGKVEHVCPLGTTTSNYYVGLEYHPREDKVYFTDINRKLFVYHKNKITSMDGDVNTVELDKLYPLSSNAYFLFPFIADTMAVVFWKMLLHKRITNGNKLLYLAKKSNDVFFYPYEAALKHIKELNSIFPDAIINDMKLHCAIPLIHPGEWCLGTAHGVFLVKEKKQLFQHISETKGYSVRGIKEQPDKSLWIGTYNGLVKYKANKIKVEKDDKYNTIWDFLPINKDSIWIASESQSGVKLITNPNQNSEKVHIPAYSYELGYCKKIAPASTGFWVSPRTNYLAYINRANSTSTFYRPSDSTATGLVKTLHYSPRSGLWQGGADGLRLYSTESTDLKEGRIFARPLPALLKSIVVNAIYEDQNGLIWIGTTNEGLVTYDPQKKTITNHWTVTDGLPHNTVYTILNTNHDSVLWLGTQNGICRLEKYSKSLQNYYDTDGLGQNEFNTGAIFQSADGTCYFGGIDGVSRFHPAQIAQNITKIVGGLDMEITNTALQSGRSALVGSGMSVQIQPDELMIEIKFRSNLLFRANDAMCRYRISGIHSDWRLVPLGEKLVLVGLKPGNYLLEYQIRSASSGWSDMATTHIHILPHWYESTWFYAIVGLLLSGLMYAFYRWRLSQLRKTYEFRKSVTDDLHDALGTRLYLLKVLAGKIVQNDRNVDQELLQKFEEQTKDALQSVRSFIWAFDPKNDTLAALYGRLTDFAENYLYPIVQELRLHIDPADKHLRITPKTKHHVLQMYQETLTNIVKHTFTEKIEIRVFLSANKNYLHLEIFNTHAGIKTDEHSDHQHKGKLSMQARANEIKAILEWEEVHPGVQVTRIQIPMNDNEN